MHLEKFQVDKFKMAAYRPLFTSTGLILWNIMKTAQDIYTITIKQIVRFQERMHFEKNSICLSSKWPPIGHYSLSHGRYLVNRARWLNHYYKAKCEFSGEDATRNFLTLSNSKRPTIGIIYLSRPYIK